MRPKIVIAVLLAGLAGLAGIFLLKPAASRSETSRAPVIEPATTQPKVVILPKADTSPKAVITMPGLQPTTNSAIVTTSDQSKNVAPIVVSDVTTQTNEQYVQTQIDRLVDLQSNDDDASLQAILKELTNPNQEIRHEAIEATIQFGGHTAVPVLQDLAARTMDPAEKQELLDAAEFLALPTLSEAKEQMKLERAKSAGGSK